MFAITYTLDRIYELGIILDLCYDILFGDFFLIFLFLIWQNGGP